MLHEGAPIPFTEFDYEEIGRIYLSVRDPALAEDAQIESIVEVYAEESYESKGAVSRQGRGRKEQ